MRDGVLISSPSFPSAIASRSGLNAVTCSCVEKSVGACKENPKCSAKSKAEKTACKQRNEAAGKYASHARTINIPPQFFGPSPISFFKKFSGSLHDHTKCETRRVWGGGAGDSEKGTVSNVGGHFLNQKRALEEHLLVRVWCGNKGKLIGYALYHSFTPQKVGDMTLEDVKAEGGGDMSVKKFRKENFAGMSDEKWLWVVRFTFFPLYQVI